MKFFREIVGKHIKARAEREQKTFALVEQAYVEERNRRIALESVVLNEKEKAYVLALLLQDEILNSHKPTSQGLYVELDTLFLNFVSNLRSKISKM